MTLTETLKIGIDQILADSGVDPRRSDVVESRFDDQGNLILVVDQA